MDNSTAARDATSSDKATPVANTQRVLSSIAAVKTGLGAYERAMTAAGKTVNQACLKQIGSKLEVLQHAAEGEGRQTDMLPETVAALETATHDLADSVRRLSMQAQGMVPLATTPTPTPDSESSVDHTSLHSDAPSDTAPDMAQGDSIDGVLPAGPQPHVSSPRDAGGEVGAVSIDPDLASITSHFDSLGLRRLDIHSIISVAYLASSLAQTLGAEPCASDSGTNRPTYTYGTTAKTLFAAFDAVINTICESGYLPIPPLPDGGPTPELELSSPQTALASLFRKINGVKMIFSLLETVQPGDGAHQNASGNLLALLTNLPACVPLHDLSLCDIVICREIATQMAIAKIQTSGDLSEPDFHEAIRSSFQTVAQAVPPGPRHTDFVNTVAERIKLLQAMWVPEAAPHSQIAVHLREVCTLATLVEAGSRFIQTRFPGLDEEVERYGGPAAIVSHSRAYLAGIAAPTNPPDLYGPHAASSQAPTSSSSRGRTTDDGSASAPIASNPPPGPSSRPPASRLPNLSSSEPPPRTRNRRNPRWQPAEDTALCTYMRDSRFPPFAWRRFKLILDADRASTTPVFDPSRTNRSLVARAPFITSTTGVP